MLKVQDFVLALMRHSDPRSSHRSFGVHEIRSLRVTPVVRTLATLNINSFL